ncbi:MAG: TonB-dependent receptor [Gemmatimonadetes bacterium]|nr:TonB-dependent receptor [Gemmatimonadota bacterium]
MCIRIGKWLWAGLLVAASVATDGLAQTGTITGRVTDAESGAPLVSAGIEVLSGGGAGGAEVLSDQDGQFRAVNLAPGTYALVVSLIGYETTRVDGVQVRGGQTTTVAIQLVPRALVLNPVIVTASKRQEKALSAPATVAVVEGRSIAERPTLNPVDHLRSTPGVDVITYGLQGANVVTRGFNNVFSGALHVLTDNRLAHVPSLRVNLMHFVAATDDDVERIEVVLGPGSALYGPNTANGVVHILTKSPFTEQGTKVAFAGGERSVVDFRFRTAHVPSDRFGFKISGQYLQGDEWRYDDPAEQEARRQADANPTAFGNALRLLGVPEAEITRRFDQIAKRDFDLKRWTVEGRADWRPAPDASVIFSVGRTAAVSGIELTGLGAAQAKDWGYDYYQVRSSYRRLFAQAYLNTSDAGDTYTLKDGESIVDRSKLFVAQVQHGLSLGERQSFTYGVDFLRTLPESDGTIYGVNEQDNDMSEVGAYLQSETMLSPRLDLVFAGRVDKHSELEDPVFSPRAALVVKPSESHSLRFTYNRAFSTPTALNLFLDKSGGLVRGSLGELGFLSRGQGTTREGFIFRRADGSLTGMRSPFTPLAAGGPRLLLPGTPETLLQFWAAAVNVVALQSARAGRPLSPQLIAYLNSIRPTAAQVGMSVLDPLSPQTPPVPVANAMIPEVPRIKESVTSTFELGYKGILGERFLLAADLWFSQHKDFTSPLIPQTPLLLLNGQQLGAYLVPRLVPVLVQGGLPPAQAQATAQAIAVGMASVPLAVVSSDKVHATGADLMATYRNFGDVDLWGSDLSATLLLSDRWSFGLAGSYVSKDHLRIPLQGVEQIVALNAPQSKGAFTVGYRDVSSGLNGELRVRYTDGFPANSADFRGLECLGVSGTGIEDCVDAFTIVDLTLGYRLRALPGTSIQLAVSNLLDEPFKSFVGTPEIGRLALLRLSWEF